MVAAIGGALIPAGGGYPSEARGERIYLVTGLLHADIAIPIDADLLARFAYLRTAGVPLDHPGLRHLVFGWGARDFYVETETLAELRPMPALKAIMGDRSVMHVLAAGEIAEAPGILAVDLPSGGRERLIAFIERSFLHMPPRHISGAAYGNADAFFEAAGSFNILRTCNVWAAHALQAAGLRTGAWTPTTLSLLLGLRVHASASIAAGRSGSLDAGKFVEQ
jgi:uncharacterized protein (TIGR02117 family)